MDNIIPIICSTIPARYCWEEILSASAISKARENISYSWFRKVFKDYTGYAPAKYFQELKLRKAKQLLVGTSLSVKEISFMLDYKSTEHFFSSFKKRTGFTPLEYRSYGRETGGEEV